MRAMGKFVEKIGQIFKRNAAPRFSKIERHWNITDIANDCWETVLDSGENVSGYWNGKKWSYNISGYDVTSEQVWRFIKEFKSNWQIAGLAFYYIEPLDAILDSVKSSNEIKQEEKRKLIGLIDEFYDCMPYEQWNNWHSVADRLRENSIQIDEIIAFIQQAKNDWHNTMGKF